MSENYRMEKKDVSKRSNIFPFCMYLSVAPVFLKLVISLFSGKICPKFVSCAVFRTFVSRYVLRMFSYKRAYSCNFSSGIPY